MSDFNYIRTHYGVPAELGRIVEMNGRRGVIVKDCGAHIGVNFEDDKPHVVSPCHPTWEMQYLGMGVTMTAAKRGIPCPKCNREKA